MNPDSIRFEPKSGRVFTFNGRSNNSTAIDAKTGMVVGTIPMGGKPEFPVADDKGHVYVNIEDTSEIVEIDAAKATVTKRYSLNAMRWTLRTCDRRQEAPAVFGLQQSRDGDFRSRCRQSHCVRRRSAQDPTASLLIRAPVMPSVPTAMAR